VRKVDVVYCLCLTGHDMFISGVDAVQGVEFTMPPPCHSAPTAMSRAGGVTHRLDTPLAPHLPHPY
jgi:hypothetical protein